MPKRIIAIFSLILVLGLAGSAFAITDPNDQEGSKDPALFTRMPGYYISRYEAKDFERYEVPVTPDFKTQAIEGRYLMITYAINEGARQASALQIVRNYANAAAAIGGSKIADFEDGGAQYLTMKIVQAGSETWMHVEAEGSQYTLYLVEKQLMKQEVVADAASLAGSIRETGKASVYGIYFDTGKSDIKPESEPVLKEIAKMLAADPRLKLYVVGHTDNVGTFAANITLSNSRADAVVKALVGRFGIAASRLQPFGAGPTAPVQSNQTEPGRAKNRRVELVAQ
jgi:OOP family OmpA-OmpF porin